MNTSRLPPTHFTCLLFLGRLLLVGPLIRLTVDRSRLRVFDPLLRLALFVPKHSSMIYQVSQTVGRHLGGRLRNHLLQKRNRKHEHVGRRQEREGEFSPNAKGSLKRSLVEDSHQPPLQELIMKQKTQLEKETMLVCSSFDP